MRMGLSKQPVRERSSGLSAFCTPLSAIKWNMEVIETERDTKECLPEKQMVFLQNIKKSNEQMLKMVTDLLEVARVDQGKSVFKESIFDLADLAKESN